MSRMHEIQRRSAAYAREHITSLASGGAALALGAASGIGYLTESPSASQSRSLDNERSLSRSIEDIHKLPENLQVILTSELNDETEKLAAIHKDPEFLKAKQAYGAETLAVIGGSVATGFFALAYLAANRESANIANAKARDEASKMRQDRLDRRLPLVRTRF